MKKNQIKIGLDIHGILDTNPIWKYMGELFVSSGNEVHVITGSLQNKALKELESIGMERNKHYTHIFSISDTLIMNGHPVTYNSDNSPVFDDTEWDKAKSIYCKSKNINMHFDDTSRYADYFSTPICIIQTKKDA